MSQAVFVLETTYSIKYTTKNPVAIPDIIKSLESTEKLLKRTPAFIEKAYGGFTVKQVDVYVENLHTGSLITDFIVTYVIGQENADDLQEIGKRIMADNNKLGLVVALGVGALTTYAVMKAQSPTAPTTHIEAYEHSTVHVGDTIGFSSDDMIAIFDKITDKKTLAKEVIDFIKPAHQDGQATIEMSGFPELTINHDFIDEAPKEYTAPTPTKKDDHYTNVDVITSSGANDKRDSIWSGLIPGVVDKNIKFILSDDVDPKKLYGRVKFKADIEVTSHYVKSKKAYEPKHVFIKTVY